VDVLSSRILLRPSDLDRSRRYCRDVLCLAVCREFGPLGDPGVVFFLGPGLLEVSGHAASPAGRSVMIWIQVRDVHAEHARMAAAGLPILREPAAEPWGLTEMWIEDPDGIRMVLVEVPADHPLRRDPRSASPPRRQTLCGRCGRCYCFQRGLPTRRVEQSDRHIKRRYCRAPESLKKPATKADCSRT
jgi:catechol 2,3-dioxygenase-like lactoylglutathione lyase family enzyme